MNKGATPYTPQLDFVYPSKTDEHMIETKIVREEIIDENYPFLDKSFKFRFMRGLLKLSDNVTLRNK